MQYFHTSPAELQGEIVCNVSHRVPPQGHATMPALVPLGAFGLPWLPVLVAMDDTRCSSSPAWPPWSLFMSVAGHVVYKEPFSAGLAGMWSTQ